MKKDLSDSGKSRPARAYFPVMGMITIRTVAEQTGESPRTVLNMIRRAGIVTQRVGRAHVLTPAQVRQLRPGKVGRPAKARGGR